MHIIQIANDEDKKRITRNILEELSEWFGIPEAREEYIRDSAGKVFFCAMENEKDLGFLYLKETGKDTVELAVMGVLEEYHRKGIGKELFNRAKKAAKEMGLPVRYTRPVIQKLLFPAAVPAHRAAQFPGLRRTRNRRPIEAMPKQRRTRTGRAALPF